MKNNKKSDQTFLEKFWSSPPPPSPFIIFGMLKAKILLWNLQSPKMAPPKRMRLELLLVFFFFFCFSKSVEAYFERDCNEVETRIYIEEKLNRYIIIVYCI
jgi:hypothetical protein